MQTCPGRVPLNPCAQCTVSKIVKYFSNHNLRLQLQLAAIDNCTRDVSFCMDRDWMMTPAHLLLDHVAYVCPDGCPRRVVCAHGGQACLHHDGDFRDHVHRPHSCYLQIRREDSVVHGHGRRRFLVPVSTVHLLHLRCYQRTQQHLYTVVHARIRLVARTITEAYSSHKRVLTTLQIITLP